MAQASEPTLAARLRADETLYTAWSAIPDPLVAEFLARSAFDTVTLDMQHGCHTVDSVLRGIAAIKLTGKPAVVRIPVGRYETASRALDFGADAVIAPMVNSVADAQAFAASMKLPPQGERSWGPTRVLALRGGMDLQTYLASANADTAAIAMIETRAALDALDGILAVDGIDGVFIGPSDLSVALSNGTKVDPVSPAVLEAAADMAAKARSAGKFAGIFAFTAATARQFRDMGFRLITISSDINYLLQGANALVGPAKQDSQASSQA